MTSISSFGFINLFICILKNDFKTNHFNYEQLEDFIIFNKENETYAPLLSSLKIIEINDIKEIFEFREQLLKLVKLGIIYLPDFEQNVFIPDAIPIYQILINYQDYIKIMYNFVSDYLTYTIMSSNKINNKNLNDYEISRGVFEYRYIRKINY